LGRAEVFASKKPILHSIADGLGMGLGFTISLTVLGAIREILGNGTIWGYHIMWETYKPFSFLLKPPGAFVCLGIMLGIMNTIGGKKEML